MRMRRMKWFALIALAGIGGTAAGQTVTATVVGTVSDASGAAIPGASVVLEEKGTGRVQRGSSKNRK
jgi:hypothetical protein